jgi:hypothetical protein
MVHVNQEDGDCCRPRLTRTVMVTHKINRFSCISDTAKSRKSD